MFRMNEQDPDNVAFEHLKTQEDLDDHVERVFGAPTFGGMSYVKEELGTMAIAGIVAALLALLGGVIYFFTGKENKERIDKAEKKIDDNNAKIKNLAADVKEANMKAAANLEFKKLDLVIYDMESHMLKARYESTVVFVDKYLDQVVDFVKDLERAVGDTDKLKEINNKADKFFAGLGRELFTNTSDFEEGSKQLHTAVSKAITELGSTKSNKPLDMTLVDKNAISRTTGLCELYSGSSKSTTVDQRNKIGAHLKDMRASFARFKDKSEKETDRVAAKELKKVVKQAEHMIRSATRIISTYSKITKTIRQVVYRNQQLILLSSDKK